MQKVKFENPSKPKPKKQRKIVLGKGLDALIPDIGTIVSKPEDYFQCDISLIHPNRYQPRRRFSEDEMMELSRSIREQGIIQPLLLRKDDNGYELIAGERRLRAAKLAGLSQVPVIIKDISDEKIIEMSIVENIQRENLNPMEEAVAYQRLISEFDFTQEQIAERVGKSRPAVANFLRLSQLPEHIKAGIMDGTLSMGHAKALLGAATSALQNEAWRAIVSKGLSVRETETLIKRLKEGKKKPKKPEPSSDEIYLSDLADELSRQLGTKVKIKRRGKKGKVEIEFYNNDDLDRLIGLLRQTSLNS
jgi:ParB family chromosome partitioning protein